MTKNILNKEWVRIKPAIYSDGLDLGNHTVLQVDI